MRVSAIAYDDMDLMDLAGPFEVLHTCNRLLARRGMEPAFRTSVHSFDGAQVTTLGGVIIAPDGRLDFEPEILLVPGAADLDSVLGRRELMAEVRRLGERATAVSSVCTGAFLLAEAGLLAGHGWTTHWEDLPTLAERLPGASSARVVDSGRVITAGGVAAGLDLGLHLVARFVDPALARLVARQIDFHWDCFGADDGGVDPVLHERWIAADPATLYRVWTSADGLLDRLGYEAVVEPRIGGRYEFLFLDAPDGVRGGEGCRILALEPDRMVVFTWNSPPGMTTRGVHTWVVLTFAAVGAGTVVRLAHWGHGTGPEWDENRAYFDAAWTRVLDRLEAAFA